MTFAEIKEALLSFAEKPSLKRVIGGIVLGTLLGQTHTGGNRIDIPVGCLGGIIFLVSALSPVISALASEAKAKL